MVTFLKINTLRQACLLSHLNIFKQLEAIRKLKFDAAFNTSWVHFVCSLSPVVGNKLLLNKKKVTVKTFRGTKC